MWARALTTKKPVATHFSRWEGLLAETSKRVTAFLSYSHRDSDWVLNTLLPRIEAAGIRTIVDVRDFQAGAIGIKEMERAVLESNYTFVVLSESYLESEWCEFENLMSQTLDPAARARRIIPLLLEDCDIPLRLRIIQHRDLSADSEAQWAKFENDLRLLKG
jgi:hypothetical protein